MITDTDAIDNEVSFHIRWMIRRDMPEVLNIEYEAVGPAWKEEDFLRCLRQRNCIGMVAEKNDKVVGFMIYELHKNRLEIIKMAALQSVYKFAIRQMVDKLKSKLSSHRRTRINFVVPLKNLSLLKLLKQENFKAIANYDDYWEDFDDDGVEMRFKLAIEHSED